MSDERPEYFKAMEEMNQWYCNTNSLELQRYKKAYHVLLERMGLLEQSFGEIDRENCVYTSIATAIKDSMSIVNEDNDLSA